MACSTRVVIDVSDTALDQERVAFGVEDPLVEADYIGLGEGQIQVFQHLGEDEPVNITISILKELFKGD